MGNNRYSYFYAAFNTAVKKGCNYSKEELVEGFTEGRTGSLKDLSDGELREIVLQLNGRTSTPLSNRTSTPLSNRTSTPLSNRTSTGFASTSLSDRSATDVKRDKMRKAIISNFKFIDKTTGDAIAWAEKYGCNGVKRKFNEYTTQELYVLIQNAEKMKIDFLKAIRKIER
jgi:hypothetical protein